MARGLNRRETVTGGVEEEAQLKLIEERGYDIYQGYLYQPAGVRKKGRGFIEAQSKIQNRKYKIP
jgi:EAL domain-containing protein (putative c-di-GMP-specific phosphodiesterase class I)